MICLSLARLGYFLLATGLPVVTDYPLLSVQSQRPALYVWRDGAFCRGGAPV